MPLLHDQPLVAVSPDRDAMLHRMPILILNVHSHCNCRCVMCDIWKRSTHEQLTAADLDRHRASLRHLGVQQVVLTGGEPLLHNDLGAVANFFREENIRLTLLTTGLLLCKRASEVSSFFHEVIVSIDGPSAIHDSIRRVQGAFEVIAKGVAAVQALNPRLPVRCRTTIQKANHRHLGATIAAAKNAGFTSISFLAADLTSQAFNRPLVWPGERQSEIGLTSKEVAWLDEEIDHLIAENAEDFRRQYIAETPEKLKRIVGRFREHLGQAIPQAPLCNAPWVSAVVETDGSVRPCFFHPPVGNIRSVTLEEVVNGEAALRFRQGLRVDENPICKRCVCSLNYRDSLSKP